jgi:hypothetical protein
MGWAQGECGGRCTALPTASHNNPNLNPRAFLSSFPIPKAGKEALSFELYNLPPRHPHRDTCRPMDLFDDIAAMAAGEEKITRLEDAV